MRFAVRRACLYSDRTDERRRKSRSESMVTKLEQKGRWQKQYPLGLRGPPPPLDCLESALPLVPWDLASKRQGTS